MKLINEMAKFEKNDVKKIISTQVLNYIFLMYTTFLKHERFESNTFIN